MPLKNMPTINPYEILGIQQGASENDIRKAFRNKMKEYHPDKNRDNLEFATEQTQLVNLAKELLTDPEKRQAIDATLVMPPLAASTEENAAKRQSWMIDDLMKSFSERFQQEPLPLLDGAKIKTLLDKCDPEKNHHFNQRYFQGLYTLKIASADKSGKTGTVTVTEEEVSFTNLYAYLEQKQRLFTDSTDKPLLPQLKTTEVILQLFSDFLKGKLFGDTLKQVVIYLLADPASLLAKAIAELFSITDLTQFYQQALSAIEVIYQTIEAEYKAYEQISRTLQKEKMLQENELAQAQHEFENAKLRCEEYERLKPTAAQKQSLEEQKNILEQQVILEKENLSTIEVEDRDEESYKKIETTQIALDSINQQITHFEEQTTEMQIRIHDEKIPERHAIIVQLTSRIAKLETEINSAKSKRFNTTFLSLLENKYFKMLIAKCMQYYWQESTNFDITQYFRESTRLLPPLEKEEYGKHHVFHLILMLADKQLQKLSTPNCSVTEVYEVAKVFVDLSSCEGTMGLIRPQALFKAGLCFQLASQRFASTHEKMAAEHLALTYYQLALRVASHASSFHLLAILPTMVKAISQMQYQHKGMMSRKDFITFLNESFGKESLSPGELNRLKIYNGNLLQTLECVLDRAQYVLSIHPLNVVSNYLTKEVSRIFFCKELLDTIAENQAKILENPETRKAFESNHSMPDQLYQYYEAKLATYDDNNHTLEQEEKMLLLRLQVMVALLERNNTSLKETNQWMNTPYIPTSQDSEGWFVAGPLNYPSDPEIAGTLYKGFLGYRINHLTGEVSFILDEWKPGDPEHLKLFTHDEFTEIVKNGINRAIFSLDQSEPYKRYAPIQTVRFSPSILENTTYARTLFLTDYLMKMMSTGREINGMAPYQTRSAEQLLETLPPEIKNELLVCANKQNSEEGSEATRFWIELGHIPVEEQQIKATEYTLFQQPTVTVKKHLLDISDDGSLGDAESDSSDHSPEAEFAHAFTKYYLEIAVQFPVFLQLVEFHKIAGAVAQMQAMREASEKKIKQLQAELDNPEHWSTLRQKTKTEWQQKVNDQAYWDRLLAETTEKYTKIVNDDDHWNLKIENILEKLNQSKMSLEAKSGEAYQRAHKEFKSNNTAMLKKTQEELKPLQWKIDSAECHKSYEDKIKEVAEKLKADNPEIPLDTATTLAKSLIGTLATYLTKLQQSTRQQLETAFSHNKSIVEKANYAQALAEFKQGKVAKLAKAQAEFITKRFFSESANKEPVQITFWQKIQTELLQRIKTELTAQVAANKPMLELQSGLKLTFSKLIYAVEDAEFLAFYNEIRKKVYDNYVVQAKAQIPTANWQQYEAHYLADINNKVDQDFSKQSQLNSFNELAKKAFEMKRAEWCEKLISHDVGIVPEFGTTEYLNIALQALVEGNVDLVAQAQTNIAINKVKAELAMGKPQENIRQTVLNPILILNGLRFQSIPTDGHCLFHAVGLYLGQEASFLRLIIAARMEANFDEFKHFRPGSDEEFRDYIEAIRKTDEWGGQIEIEIIQRVTNRPIIIIRPDGNPTIPDNLGNYHGDPIFIYYNGYTHYDAFILEEGADPKEILAKIQTQLQQDQKITYNPDNPVTQFDEPSQPQRVGLAKDIWQEYVTEEIKKQTTALTAMTQSQTQAPSFDHLEEIFAEQAFKQLIELFIQGNIQPLLEAETEHDIFKQIEQLSYDQRVNITEQITKEREDLRQNLQQRAKSRVDAQKQAWQTNLENALDEYISELQEEHRENIQKLGRLSQGFERIKLGRSTSKDESANTHYRIPAVISKTNNRTIYGGVCALPSFHPALQKRNELFKKLEEADRSVSFSKFLNPFSMFSAATSTSFLSHHISFSSRDLDNARREVSEVSKQASFRDFSLQRKIWETERKIRDAEHDLQSAQHSYLMETFSAPWRRRTFQTYVDPLRFSGSYFDGELGIGSTGLPPTSNPMPPTGPFDNGQTPLGFWRTAEQKQKELSSFSQPTSFGICGSTYCVKTSDFGERQHPVTGRIRFHDGVDLVPQGVHKVQGHAIQATENGVVISRQERRGYGNTLVIKLDDGRSLLFAHLDVHGEHQDLNEGNKIKIGDTIGRIGNTGIGTAPHLHLEVITPAGTTLIERGSFPAPQTERENPIEYLTRTNSLRPGKRQ